MPNLSCHMYEFGPFTLDPGEQMLRHGEDRIDLPPRVFNTLVVLAESKGRLIEKDELMKRIWPEAVVEENNLTQIISLLRKVLGDGKNGVRYIETVPKRGYRFVAFVRDLAPQGSQVPPERSLNPAASMDSSVSAQMPSSATPVSRRGNKLYWAVGLAIMVIGIVVIERSGFSQYKSHPIRSIAVLPLQNFSGDPGQQYFADGMTDELITDLAQIRELKVVSETSVMQYKGTRKTIPEIGHELGVDAVVEGSVLRIGDRVRITAQLIQANTDRHLWAQAFDGDLKNVLGLQANVAEAITEEVRVNLNPQEKDRLRLAQNYDPVAYDLYLRGRYAVRRRDAKAFHEAMGFYEQAVANDPEFALAYSGLADCYTLLALYGEGSRWLPDAMANARRALSLDETLPEAHRSLAAAYVLSWQWDNAESEFRRAIELNPNDAQAHQWYGNLFLGPLGRHPEAIAELRRALDLDPLSAVINTDLGYAYFLAGDFDAAFQQYQKVLSMDPGFLPVHYDLMLYYRQRGQSDAEVRELLEDFKLAGRTSEGEAMGKLATNRKEFYQTLARPGGSFDAGDAHSKRLPSFTALAYIAIGEKEQALASLQECLRFHDPEMIYLKADPTWASLGDEPAFREMERKVGLLSR